MDTIPGVRSAMSARPASRPPRMTLKTPAGTNSEMTLAIHTVEAGVTSEGLSTTVLPAASAGANFHTAIMKG